MGGGGTDTAPRALGSRTRAHVCEPRAAQKGVKDRPSRRGDAILHVESMASRAASEARENSRGVGLPARDVVACVAAWALVLGACGRVGFEQGVERDGGEALSSDGSVPTDASSSPPDAAGDLPDEAAPDAPTAAPDALTTDADSGGPDAVDAAMDAARCSVAGPANVDYCATLPFLPDAPVIDGTPDCALSLRDLTPVDWTGGATTPDATAQYAVAWRPDGLYFFVQVHDPSLVPAEPSELSWQGDEVELYMDSDGTYAAPPAYDNPGTRQFTIAAPSSASSSVARAQVWFSGSVGIMDWTSTEFRAYGQPDGYVVEAFVTGPDLGLGSVALSEGGLVGMDLSIGVSYPSDRGADAGGGGNRLGQYFLRVADPDAGGGVPPFDTRAFCRPTLAPR
jgi:hypothetical protein